MKITLLLSYPGSLKIHRFGLLGAMVLGLTVVSAQEVSIYRSSKAGDRLSHLPSVQLTEQNDSTAAAFKIDQSVRHQKMLGFGASFLEAGMICLNSLEKPEQEKVLEALFDPEKGAGFSAMKTVIASTDFMSAGPWYSYNDTAGDVDMKHFSIARDLEPNGLIPYIKAAQKHGDFILQTTMDYPPDWMLVDVKTDQNIQKKYYDALALYYLRYLQEYEKEGIFIDFISLFNEPMGYTKIKFPEIAELLKNHVGPLFEREAMKTKLQMCDIIDRATAGKSLPTILDDPDAYRYVANLSYHGYDWRRKEKPSEKNNYRAEEFEPIAELAKRYPDLPLWMTEICYYNWGTPWANPLPRYEFDDCDFWGNQIFQDIAAGASGWTYWNMILDEEGGPWLVSLEHKDPAINHQQPVVIVNRQTGQVTYTGLYYYLAHFSKFVRPDSVRIGTSGEQKGVRCLAFEETDGRVVVQLMNSGFADSSVRIAWKSKTFDLVLPRISLTTCAWSPESDQ